MFTIIKLCQKITQIKKEYLLFNKYTYFIAYNDSIIHVIFSFWYFVEILWMFYFTLTISTEKQDKFIFLCPGHHISLGTL
jgi:hypothetical protein